MRQPLLDWSGHVRSWADQTDVPVMVVRYEDMLQSPIETFERVLGFLDALWDRASVERAVRHADFSELKGQERRAGFVDRGAASKESFRNGQAGEWRERLTGSQVRRIEARHGETLAQAAENARSFRVGSPESPVECWKGTAQLVHENRDPFVTASAA